MLVVVVCAMGKSSAAASKQGFSRLPEGMSVDVATKVSAIVRSELEAAQKGAQAGAGEVFAVMSNKEVFQTVAVELKRPLTEAEKSFARQAVDSVLTELFAEQGDDEEPGEIEQLPKAPAAKASAVSKSAKAASAAPSGSRPRSAAGVNRGAAGKAVPIASKQTRNVQTRGRPPASPNAAVAPAVPRKDLVRKQPDRFAKRVFSPAKSGFGTPIPPSAASSLGWSGARAAGRVALGEPMIRPDPNLRSNPAASSGRSSSQTKQSLNKRPIQQPKSVAQAVKRQKKAPQQEEKENVKVHWIQCDKCTKWRIVDVETKVHFSKRKFNCSMLRNTTCRTKEDQDGS